MSQHPGTFLVFEGGEGVGKTTQIGLLADHLRQQGHRVTVTREPGGSALGRPIRQILLDPATGAINPRTEALLFAADRAEHVATVIRPALARGHVVISDRYLDSSVAYQGSGRGLTHDEVRHLSLWATDGLLPDLTLVLDLDPQVGRQRATRDEFGAADRMESEALDFAVSVREAFLALAAAHQDRYAVIDAAQPPHEVAAQVRHAATGILPESNTPAAVGH